MGVIVNMTGYSFADCSTSYGFIHHQDMDDIISRGFSGVKQKKKQQAKIAVS